jgi:DUF971 family protein
MPPVTPIQIELIGNEVAIRWTDGTESYYNMQHLRAVSPSAENTGESDLFGRIHGGDTRTEFPGVSVIEYEHIGAYAIRFIFSDGHKTGLYTYAYLREIATKTP